MITFTKSGGEIVEFGTLTSESEALPSRATQHPVGRGTAVDNVQKLQDTWTWEIAVSEDAPHGDAPPGSRVDTALSDARGLKGEVVTVAALRGRVLVNVAINDIRILSQSTRFCRITISGTQIEIASSASILIPPEQVAADASPTLPSEQDTGQQAGDTGQSSEEEAQDASVAFEFLSGYGIL